MRTREFGFLPPDAGAIPEPPPFDPNELLAGGEEIGYGVGSLEDPGTPFWPTPYDYEPYDDIP